MSILALSSSIRAVLTGNKLTLRRSVIVYRHPLGCDIVLSYVLGKPIYT